MNTQTLEEIIEDLKSRHLTPIEALADNPLALLLIIQKLEGELLVYKRNNDKTIQEKYLDVINQHGPYISTSDV